MKRCYLSLFLLFFVMVLFAQKKSDERFLISVEAGKGCLIGKSNVSPVGVNYRNQYSSGISINTKVMYFWNSWIGVGLKGNSFTTSGDYLLNGKVNYADDIVTYYVAPQLEMRRSFRNNFLISFGMGIGYMYYKNESANEINMKTISHSDATNMDLMFEYKIMKRLSIRGGVSCIAADNFKKMKRTIDQDTNTIKPQKWDKIQMFRIDYVFGIVGAF